MIRIVTDSTSQLTHDQAATHDISIVPMTIIIDGVEYSEGLDLATESFYESIGDGVMLSTSQPSPATFIETYQRLVAEGATEILSVHLSEANSGTLNAARIAAGEVSVPIHLIDSKMTSYGLGVIALMLADHVATGGTAETAVLEAELLVPTISMVFILQDVNYVLRGGRIRQPELPSGTNDVPVLAGAGGHYELIGTGRTIDNLTDQMAAALLQGHHLRHVAVAHAAPDTIEFTEGLEAQLGSSHLVVSVHRYRMSPSIAVHTGPGTAGGFSWPAHVLVEDVQPSSS